MFIVGPGYTRSVETLKTNRSTGKTGIKQRIARGSENSENKDLDNEMVEVLQRGHAKRKRRKVNHCK